MPVADATTRKLLELLAEGRPDLRCAAAMMLGAIQPKGKQIIKSLGATLQDPNPQLRRASMDAIGKVGGKDALPYLLQVVRAGGEEAELGAESIAKTGSSGVKLLLKEMEGGAPSVKKAIAIALSRSGAQHAVDTALQSLLDENPEVVDAARRSLESEAQRGDESARKNLAKRMIAFLSKKDVLTKPTAVGASLRILEMLRDPGAEKMLWKWATSSYPGPIRAAALRALSNLPPPDKSALKPLFKLLDEKDPSLVRPALEILNKLPVPSSFLSKLLMLLESPENAIRLFALRALRHIDQAKVADAVLARLHHPDPEMRRVAEEVASGLSSARKVLARQLLASKDVATCWAIVRVLQREVGGIDPSTMRSLSSRALLSVERDESWSEPLLHFVRRQDPKRTFAELRKRGMQLRKAKKFAEAVRCLRLITREPDFSPVERFELALAGLMLSPKKTDSAARAADHCLGHFTTLAHMDQFRLFDRLKKEKIVGAEECFYIGFHFLERGGGEKKTGVDLLKHCLKRWKKSKVSKEAKEKLASVS